MPGYAGINSTCQRAQGHCEVVETAFQGGNYRRVPMSNMTTTTLGYALMRPIIQARIVWMHVDATTESRRMARDICHRHVEFFITTAFLAGAGSAS